MYRPLIKLLASMAVLFAFTTSSQAFVLWTDHEDGNDHLYTVGFLPGSSWGEANEAVASLGDGWHLATITSANEQSFLENNLYMELIGKYWLGGYQTDGAPTNEGWNWVTGESWDYENWEPSQPDDFGGQDQRWLVTDSNFDWQWGDNRWSSRHIVGFIAEKTVPEPYTLALLGAGLAFLGFLGRRKA